MSFRAAQDHNMAAGRDTTLSTPSSNRREDPVATTWRRNRSLLSHVVVLILISLVMNYIVVELAVVSVLISLAIVLIDE
jgi:4-hydroxybenzoate polyprenyltransferase